MPTDGTYSEPLQQRGRAMTQALREWDPDAEVQMEVDTGRLSILTTLPTDRVVAILKSIGEDIQPSGEQSECGSQCCGGCSG